MNKTQACDLLDICTDIEICADALDGLLTTMGFILDKAESDSEDATKDANNALCFSANYPVYSKMLFTLFGGLNDRQKELQSLAKKAYDIHKAIREEYQNQ